ncbi:MAG: SCO family protein [Planctomycetota bacterium]
MLIQSVRKSSGRAICFALVWMLFAQAAVTLSAQDSSTPENEPAENATGEMVGEETVDLDEINALPELDQDKLPEAAQDIQINQRTGYTVDLDSFFYDENNHHVPLKRYFSEGQPVMLSFNYSNCPKLCSVQLENMILALRDVDFKVGDDFQMVSISIDPLEQSSRAFETKEKYTKLYNKPGTEDGFHFMTGNRDEIEFMAEECGFGYKYVPEQKLYSHLPVFILLSPEGKIVRYIHGLDYDPVTIERALIEAAEGKIGSPINRISYGLGCFLFDESTGQYTFQVMALMRIGGALTVIALVGALVPYWFFKRGNKTQDKSQDKGNMAAATQS